MSLRGGLIGCGYIADRQLRAWQRLEGAEITAVCDLDGEKAGRVAKTFGIARVYTDAEQMMDEVPLDFVDIATRPNTHLPLTTAAAGRGLHVVCQKPIADSLAEAQEIVDVCKRAGVTLMINENARHQAWFRKLKALIGEGALGNVHYARFEDRKRTSLPRPRFSKQPYFQEMPRLVVYEMGVHYLDTARYLFGEATTVYARLQRVSPHIAGEDRALIVSSFGDLDCLLDMSWCSVSEPFAQVSWCKAHVEGTRGTAILGRDGVLSLYTDDDQASWSFPEDSILQSFVATQQHFIDCLRSGQEPETSGAETLKTMALVFAAYRSASEGQPQDVLGG